jgi:hypothetical protein
MAISRLSMTSSCPTIVLAISAFSRARAARSRAIACSSSANTMGVAVEGAAGFADAMNLCQSN